MLRTNHSQNAQCQDTPGIGIDNISTDQRVRVHYDNGSFLDGNIFPRGQLPADTSNKIKSARETNGKKSQKTQSEDTPGSRNDNSILATQSARVCHNDSPVIDEAILPRSTPREDILDKLKSSINQIREGAVNKRCQYMPNSEIDIDVSTHQGTQVYRSGSPVLENTMFPRGVHTVGAPDAVESSREQTHNDNSCFINITKPKPSGQRRWSTEFHGLKYATYLESILDDADMGDCSDEEE